MTFLLSLAAQFGPAMLAPWLGLWRALRQGVACALGWIGASRLHLALAALGLSLLANGWQWHHARTEIARKGRAIALWQQAYTLERRAFALLGAQVAQQNASIEALHQAGLAGQRAAAAALARVAAQEGQRQRLAAAMTRDAASVAAAPGVGCATPAAVLRARGQL